MHQSFRLENDSPSRGRKLRTTVATQSVTFSLENDSPSRGRKRVLCQMMLDMLTVFRK